MTAFPRIPPRAETRRSEPTLRVWPRAERAAAGTSASKPDINKFACAFLLVLAIAFGGGTTPGSFGDLLIELVALPVLGLGILRLRVKESPLLTRFALGWFALAAMFIVLQCIPLPYTWWAALPGRAEIAGELTQAGIGATAHPLSLNPYATERMLWTLLPPAAVFVCTQGLRERDRLDLLRLMFALTVTSIVLGLAQVAGGADSALRLYPVTNPTEAVGFFANRNHYASLLILMLPLALVSFGAGVFARVSGRTVAPLSLVAFGLLVILLIMGLMLARSRAGLVLGMLGIVGGLVAIASVAWRAELRSRVTRIIVATAAIGLALALQYGLYGMLERLQNDPADDARWTLLATTLEAARHFGAWGTGLGTFVNVYQSFETPGIMLPAYVNHAHNDWAELWLEGGWPAAVLATLLLAWLAAAALNAWRRRDESPLLAAVRRAASFALALVLLHEFVDYGLRTMAMLCAFALLCGLMAAGAPHTSSQTGQRRPNSGRGVLVPPRVQPRQRRGTPNSKG